MARLVGIWVLGGCLVPPPCSDCAVTSDTGLAPTADTAACVPAALADFDTACVLPEDCVAVALDPCRPAGDHVALHQSDLAAWTAAEPCGCSAGTTSGSTAVTATCTDSRCEVVAR